MVYEFGQLVRIRGEFTRLSDGAAIDPTTVKVSVRRPGGKVTTYQYSTDVEVVKLRTGVYYLDVSANAYGTWTYRWFSEGTGQAADESVFQVKQHRAVKGEP